jgi:LacI family transcriptional regulator
MTVREIARRAGISAMAASLALRGSPRISEGLKLRVKALARDLGYVPNPRISALMEEVRRARNNEPHSGLALVSLHGEMYPRSLPHLSRLAAGAYRRARELGYRLEEFVPGLDGLTPRRLRSILEARGVRGILCLGSADPGAEFPSELRRFSVVTLGMTISTPLHRVASHHLKDGLLLFDELQRRGYRRPGLLIDPDWEVRTGHAYSAACLLAQERAGMQRFIPVHRTPGFESDLFGRWFRRHKPDVIIVNQRREFYSALEGWLPSQTLRVPRDLGVAFLGTRLTDPFYTGVAQNHELIGRSGIESLIARLQIEDTGVPQYPRVELVEGAWFEGRSLRHAG